MLRLSFEFIFLFGILLVVGFVLVVERDVGVFFSLLVLSGVFLFSGLPFHLLMRRKLAPKKFMELSMANMKALTVTGTFIGLGVLCLGLAVWEYFIGL